MGPSVIGPGVVGPGDQTGRPYIHRLMRRNDRRTVIVNYQLSIVN